MKEIITCLREFAGLKESDQPPYLIKIGRACTTNAGTFPLLAYPGPTITTHALNLVTLLGSRKESAADQDLYDTEVKFCVKMMESTYDAVDLVAQGDSLIIAKSGATGTSANTTKIGIAGVPTNLAYEFADGAGEMYLTRDADKLANGSVIVTYTAKGATVVKSGNTQLKITAPDGSEYFVDVVTVINALIQNQVKGSEINSVISNYNTNGISPVASPTSIVVPR